MARSGERNQSNAGYYSINCVLVLVHTFGSSVFIGHIRFQANRQVTNSPHQSRTIFLCTVFAVRNMRSFHSRRRRAQRTQCYNLRSDLMKNNNKINRRRQTVMATKNGLRKNTIVMTMYPRCNSQRKGSFK